MNFLLQLLIIHTLVVLYVLISFSSPILTYSRLQRDSDGILGPKTRENLIN